METLIHGWDIAKGTGRTTRLDPEPVAVCLPSAAASRANSVRQGIGDDLSVKGGWIADEAACARRAAAVGPKTHGRPGDTQPMWFAWRPCRPGPVFLNRDGPSPGRRVAEQAPHNGAQLVVSGVDRSPAIRCGCGRAGGCRGRSFARLYANAV